MTKEELQAELAKLRVETTATPVEPVTVSGWYRNTDDTRSRFYWADGTPQVSATIAADADTARFEELELALLAIWEAEHNQQAYEQNQHDVEEMHRAGF